MTLESIAPEFTSTEWILVCGFISTAFFSQFTRKKSQILKVLEIISLVAGSIFTLAHAPWFFAIALVLFCLALVIRIKFKLDVEPSTKSSRHAQGASGS